MSIITGLQNARYTSTISAKGRYMQGVVPLLGGQFALDILCDQHIIRLFSSAAFRKGHPYTFHELTQIAAPAAEMARFITQTQQLSARGALIRGYRLQCPTCDLETWYGLDDVSEMVICQGCRTAFQLPLDVEFAFRPNQLLMEALKSGALTTLLTLHRWLQDSPLVLWQAAVMLERDGDSTEMDLIVQREDGLWMAECKDRFETDPESIDALQKRLRKAVQIAGESGATFAFSTLMEGALPVDFEAFLAEQQIVLLGREALLHSSRI
jgi:hypothetical protein